jgi:tRNA-splicing ligase RtcB (3'-phosphate/5'-hydroxy nucleic acid ligase)
MMLHEERYHIWGKDQIDQGAIEQMDNAMRLPVSVAGALMPDAHVGYGLPIGGVLATRGVVIPYAVGVDIACRMRLTIFPIKPHILRQKPDQFKKALQEKTLFGAGKEFKPKDRPHHPVLDDRDWKATWLLRSVKDKAWAQLGTSGSGNHFVEWGAFELHKGEELGELKPGEYLALLSHSGSRGVGFQVANHYSQAAKDLHPELDKTLHHLAWLSLDNEFGQEYWLSMEIAGKFAAANHEVIHERLAKATGLKPAYTVENHHNFAWQEEIDGKKFVVHRKGATPAGEGVMGIIPGSMGDAGYLVRGKGNVQALNSASHGAGRLMGRKQALNSITKTMRNNYLRERDIVLMGGDLDESPQAYKPIEQVIAAQSDLVDLVGKFTPRIVKMDGR